MPAVPQDATKLLAEHAAGDASSASRLLPLVYDQLRGLAASYMRGERADHTLQPTALVHEAYLRLIDQTRIDWQGKTHFFAMSATQMRRILVEHARARQAEKRGGDLDRTTLVDVLDLSGGEALEMLALDEALDKLSRESSRQARVAELRVFVGLEIREIAFILGISESSVKRDWRVARAWLQRELADPHGS